MPARIVCEGGLWQALVDGVAFPPSPLPEHAEGMDRIWPYGTPIEQSEYDWLLALKAAALVAQPDHPALHPYTAVDPARLRPLQPPPATQRTPR